MKKNLILLLVNSLLILYSSGGIHGICYTESCNESAAELLKHMDLDVDPCHDFYRFTCGKFLRETHLTEEDVSISATQFLENDLNDKLKDLLEEPVDSISKLYETVTKQFYRSCINTDSIEEKDTKPILDIFDQFGGWPMVKSDWDENENDLTTILIKLNNFGFSNLIDMQVYVDDKDSSIKLPVLFQPKVSFQHGDYDEGLDGPKLKLLRNLINQTIHLLKNDLNEDQIDQDIEDMLTFEINLCKILLTPEETGRRQTTLTNVANLTQTFDGAIRFDDFIQEVFQEAGITILLNQSVQLFFPPFIAKLPELLRTTNHRTIINYLLWKVLSQSQNAMPLRFREVNDNYVQALLGFAGEKDRWKDCLGTVNDILSDTVGAMYARKHFKESAKEKLLALIGELKSEFIEMLDKNVWMSEETKEEAKLKAGSMKTKIGYPDEILEPDYYDEILSGIVMTEDAFLENWFILRKSLFLDALKSLIKPRSNDSFVSSIASINAYYISSANAIEFPGGILQHPFFKEDRAMYQNFGAIGTVIGHEITHGFDGTGRLYNKEGSNQNWWMEEDVTKFLNLSQCFIDQYDGFVAEEVNERVNGRLTLDENIADVGGLRQAYRAYKKWASELPEYEVELPGLPYSPEQMLFIYFGRLNCFKARREIEILLIKTDGHSPAEFRVNGAAMNLREFSETFNCPVGSPMNPADKCQIW